MAKEGSGAALSTAEKLKGTFTCCGCVHFINKHRDDVGCFGDTMLDICTDAIQRQVSK